MLGFAQNIEQLTLENTHFRHVVYTSQHAQVVLMCLQPNEEIGLEIHAYTDQFFRFEKGQGTVVINGEEHLVKDGDAVVVPAGAEHNVINTSSTESLHMYTIYAPPHHVDGIIHHTKQDAEMDTTDHL